MYDIFRVLSCSTKIAVERVVYFSFFLSHFDSALVRTSFIALASCPSLVHVLYARVSTLFVVRSSYRRIWNRNWNWQRCVAVRTARKRWIFHTRTSCCRTRRWPWTTRPRPSNDIRPPTWDTITIRPAGPVAVAVPEWPPQPPPRSALRGSCPLTCACRSPNRISRSSNRGQFFFSKPRYPQSSLNSRGITCNCIFVIISINRYTRRLWWS